MLFIYSAFYLHNDIPSWLFMTIIGRDIALVRHTLVQNGGRLGFRGMSTSSPYWIFKFLVSVLRLLVSFQDVCLPSKAMDYNQDVRDDYADGNEELKNPGKYVDVLRSSGPLENNILFQIIGTSFVRYQTLPPPKTLGRYFDFGLVSVKLNPTWVSKVKIVCSVYQTVISSFQTNTLIQFLLPIWLMANSSGYLGSSAVVDMSTNLFFGLTLSTTLISTAEYFIFRRDLLTGKPVLTTLKNMTK